MRMKFNKTGVDSYLSIKKSFKIPEFKDFNIITGVIGSGKTHFLQAIKENVISVEIDNEEVNTEDIALFDYKNFTLQNEQSVPQDFVTNEKEEILSIFDRTVITYSNGASHIFPLLQDYFKVSRDYFLFGKLLTIENIESIKIEKEKFSTTEQSKSFEKFKKRFKYYLDEIKKGFDDLKKTNEHIRVYFSDKKDIYSLSGIEIENAIIDYKDPNFIKKGFGEIFKIVQDAKIRFQEEQIQKDEANKQKTVEEIEKEYQDKYGIFPWIFINDILEKFHSENFNFNYRVKIPTELPNESMKVKFTRINTDGSTDEFIEIENFSSGEKVLLTLALFLLKAQRGALPKILLFDEIDATLHPSMCKNLINALKESIVAKEIKIIFVTHTPSTVAFCNEETDGIFVIENSQKIEEQSKEKAIEILSEGFVVLGESKANLSIAHTIANTKFPVLFTEGPTDQTILENAWEKLYPKKEKNFSIENGFDAGHLGSLLRRKDSGIYKYDKTDQIIIALFDFDKAGYNAWNGLVKEFSNHKEYKYVKKHKDYSVYAMLLPCPENDEIKKQVFDNDKESFGDKASLAIEHLFYGKIKSNCFKKQSSAGGGKIIDFTGDKSKFAEKSKEFTKDQFKNFVPLFEIIQNIIENKR